METLFTVEPNYPQGFSYSPQFISAEEEMELLDVIKGLELRPFVFEGYEAKRKVASLGQDWSFEYKTLLQGRTIPDVFKPLIQKVAAHTHIAPQHFAELLVTEYPAGAVINWHRDAPPFDMIAGISLLSPCTFRLRPHDKKLQNRSSIISFPVQRRSLYVMQGPSRSEWQHSIAAVKALRYSITLRTLKA